MHFHLVHFRLSRCGERGEKAKVKYIGTAARNLHLVCPEFIPCQTRGKKPQKRKIWLEERNDPASLQSDRRRTTQTKAFRILPNQAFRVIEVIDYDASCQVYPQSYSTVSTNRRNTHDIPVHIPSKPPKKLPSQRRLRVDTARQRSTCRATWRWKTPGSSSDFGETF